MKRTFKFWTPSEDNMLKTCMSKFNSYYKAAQWACTKLDRSQVSVYSRIIFLSQNPTPTYRPERKTLPSVKKQEKKGINIPAGFTFDIKPSKAVMFQDHVRLYF